MPEQLMANEEAVALIAEAREKKKLLVNPIYNFVFFPSELNSPEAMTLLRRTPGCWHLGNPQVEYERLCGALRIARNAHDHFLEKAEKHGEGIVLDFFKDPFEIEQ